MIVGQNSLLNQYVPTFYIKNVQDGQGLRYDATRKAYVNVDGAGGTGATKLGELLNVSPTVDSPNPTLANGQSLTYNALTSLWENSFVDYNTLLNAPVIPTNSSFSFSSLSDTAKPSLPGGYVLWNSTGTQLVYSTTIPAASISGLATVAHTGDYNDLINKPSTLGTVTTVSVVPANGVSGIVSNPNTTPAITLTLGNITPTSVVSSGTIYGSNISGVNTGDQTITLTGDVLGTGTGSFQTSLATVNSTTGIFGTATMVPQFTVDGKGRITHVVNVPINSGGLGTVTSVTSTGMNGVVTSVTNNTTVPNITIGLGNITPTSIASTGTITGSNFTGNSSGINTGDQTITLTGDVYGSGKGSFPATLAIVNGSPVNNAFQKVTVNNKGLVISTSAVAPVDITTALGFTPYNAANPAGYTSNTGTVTSVTVAGTTGRIVTTGSPITSSSTISVDLAASGATAGTYGSSVAVPQIVVDTYGRITAISNVSIPLSTGTVTSVSAAGTQGITISGSPITTSGTINIGLGNITPISVAATGTITGSNISGTNAGDQTITAHGDATGVSSGIGANTSLPITLATVNATPGTYGDSYTVPTVTVNNKGLVTSVATAPIDITVSDLLPADGSATETFTIASRHQYIVTGRLEIVGHVINNGRIAVL